MNEAIELVDDIFFLVDRARSESLLVDGRTEDDDACISAIDRYLDTVQSDLLELKQKLARARKRGIA